MYRGVYVYPWDLADEGVDTVAARLEDAGVNTITLATSYHAGKFLRPHANGRKVYFPEDGTVYFRPDAGIYGRIKPIVNSMVSEFDAMGEIGKKAPQMACVAWTVCLHNTALGMAHPELTTQNLFGDPIFPSLCPSNPDVADYVVNLCCDQAENYGPQRLALETPGWLPYNHGFHHEFSLIEMNSWIETLLGMCFCGRCRADAKGAGIEIDRLQVQARDSVERFFTTSTTPSAEMAQEWSLAECAAEPEWAAFFNWRCKVVANLVRRIRSEMKSTVELSIIPTVQTPNALCWSEGSDLKMLAEAADSLEIPAYQTGVAAIRDDIWDVRRRTGPEARLYFILRPSYPNLFGADEVKSAVTVLREADMEGVGFYNYGHWRLESLDWIKSALGRIP